jgi:hypothetical protein
VKAGSLGVVLGVLVSALLVAVPAGAAREPVLVRGYTQIGSYEVRGGNIEAATAAFGTPTKVTPHSAFCIVNWPGIRVSFSTVLSDQQCVSKSFFDDALITGPWVTDRGLKQGDTLTRALKLYPKARKGLVDSYGYGLIVVLSQAVGSYGLGVDVKNGHVTTLVVLFPQGGD